MEAYIGVSIIYLQEGISIAWKMSYSFQCKRGKSSFFKKINEIVNQEVSDRDVPITYFGISDVFYTDGKYESGTILSTHRDYEMTLKVQAQKATKSIDLFREIDENSAIPYYIVEFVFWVYGEISYTVFHTVLFQAKDFDALKSILSKTPPHLFFEKFYKNILLEFKEEYQYVGISEIKKAARGFAEGGAFECFTCAFTNIQEIKVELMPKKMIKSKIDDIL